VTSATLLPPARLSLGCCAVLALLAALSGAARAESSHTSTNTTPSVSNPSSSTKASDSSAKATGAPAAPLSALDEQATATFKDGLAAFDRRDFEAARVAFLQTFALKPGVPVVRRNLGLAEIYSGYYLDGARRLARVLHTTDEGSAEDRARMQESLKKAEAHLERVSVEVRQEGAEVFIDGVDLGASPLPFLWYVAPGAYQVRVEKAGFSTHTESRVARAGGAQHLVILLAPVPEAPPPAAPAAPAPLLEPPRPAGPNGWLLLTGGVLSAAAFAGGAAFTVAAGSNADKVQRLGEQLDTYDGYGCKPPNLPACPPLLSATKTHDRQQRWALLSFAAAGATSLTTLLYALLGGEDSASGAEDDPPLAHESRAGRRLSAGWVGSGPYLLWSGDF